MKRDMRRAITEQELRTYEEDGVVWLRGILDERWVTMLAEAIDEMLVNPIAQMLDFTGLGMAMAQQAGRSGIWRGDNSWNTAAKISQDVLLDDRVRPAPEQRGHFICATETWKHSPAIRELALQSPVPKIAALLMRSSKVYVYGDQVLVKPPGTMERTAWHQDLGYDHLEGSQASAVRIPTTRETPEMGLVRYWRGSHKSGTIYKVNYFISDRSDDDQGVPVPEIFGHESDFDLVEF